MVLGEVAPLTHPFPDAKPKQWQRFVLKLKSQTASDISTSGRIGLFGIGARRLQDLGLMREVRKISVPHSDTASYSIYMGKFVEPLSMERFLSTPRIQYNVFKTSMTEYRDAAVKSGLNKLIGKDIGGEPLTMSGLLGLASQAGIKGAKSWLCKPQERERFPHTTQTFLETNGIF